MKYYFKPSALHNLKNLPKKTQINIIKKLDYLISLPNPLKFAKPLRDKSLGDFRFRVGDYRIIFDVEINSIIILKIGHRKSIYK